MREVGGKYDCSENVPAPVPLSPGCPSAHLLNARGILESQVLKEEIDGLILMGLSRVRHDLQLSRQHMHLYMTQ